jgi:hypothetical protein
MEKGIVITTRLLVAIVFTIIAAVILLLLWGSFTAEAGKPTSNIFYEFFDWITGFVS